MGSPVSSLGPCTGIAFKRNGIRVSRSSSVHKTSNQYRPIFAFGSAKSTFRFAPCSSPRNSICHLRTGPILPSGSTSLSPISKCPTADPDFTETNAVRVVVTTAPSIGSGGTAIVYVSTMRIRLGTLSCSTKTLSQTQAACTHGLALAVIVSCPTVPPPLPWRSRLVSVASRPEPAPVRPWRPRASRGRRRQGSGYLAPRRAWALARWPLGRSARPTDSRHAVAWACLLVKAWPDCHTPTAEGKCIPTRAVCKLDQCRRPLVTSSGY
jgi:hypothetical protein